MTDRRFAPWRALAERIAALQPGERAPVAWAFVQFACVLTATFVLRAVRDEMGIRGGVKELAWMFSATFVVTIAVVPLYGWAAKRLGRRALSVAIYVAFAATMLLAWLAFAVAPTSLVLWLGRAAFVWLSVINMIAVATFWSAIVDIFTPEEGRRTFGLVAAGGTVGALVGPALAVSLPAIIGTDALFGLSAVAFVAAAVCAVRLDRSVEGRTGVVSGTRPVGGSVLEGLRVVAVSAPLRGIAIYIALYTTTSTVLYVVQAEIVESAFTDSDARTAWFASIDFAANVLALCAQLALTGALLRRMALSAVLILLPIVTVAALLLLGAWPTVGLLAIAQTIRRAGEHAVAKPGRELLYARLDRESKFKGQNAVDTVVYRACDAAAAWLVRGIAEVVAGVSSLLWAFTPLALVWVWWGWRLGRGSGCTRNSARQPVGETHAGSIDGS